MNTYKARTLISGYKLGKPFGGKTLVAVPERRLNEPVKVVVGKDFMVVDKTKSLLAQEFEDKFGRGTYKLLYFEWKLASVGVSNKAVGQGVLL